MVDALAPLFERTSDTSDLHPSGTAHSLKDHHLIDHQTRRISTYDAYIPAYSFPICDVRLSRLLLLAQPKTHKKTKLQVLHLAFPSSLLRCLIFDITMLQRHKKDSQHSYQIIILQNSSSEHTLLCGTLHT